MKQINKRHLFLLLAAGALTLLLIAIWTGIPGAHGRQTAEPPAGGQQTAAETVAIPDLILSGAREEVKRKTRYDASYRAIGYPGGDVETGRGACTDVVIRALRAAGFDLQLLIHEDMCENFNLYPPLWGLSKPDPNIDHRRTQNQMVYLERFGRKLTLEVTETELSQWRYGDLVYWSFPDGQEHTGVISDRTNREGVPLVIHNNSVAREEDCLLRWEIVGHYRFPAQDEGPH